MKKVMLVSLCLTLICCALCSCSGGHVQNNGYSEAANPGKMRSEIKAAVEQQYGVSSELVGEYYECFDGWVVFLIPTDLEEVTYKDIGGYEFAWHSSFFLGAYKDGAVYEAEAAYQEGILPLRVIAYAHELHRAKGS
ncbi:MAG: hypothetical protein E7438_02985 [Ruminococcaceae bacterium]|nr:hypothetical protein [Oscillospiraceae bacterium]